MPVEIVSADHQNKPDVGAAIARKWFDSDHVDVIMDLPNSAVALAVIAVATEKNKAVIGSGAGSSVHDRSRNARAISFTGPTTPMNSAQASATR